MTLFLSDIQPPVKQSSDTNATPPASTLSSAVDPENHLHCDQRLNAPHHSNGSVNRDHPSSDRNNRFTNTTSHNDCNLFSRASHSQWAEAGEGIELWNNTDSLTTGNCSLNSTHNSGPLQEKRTQSNTDGREGNPAATEHRERDISGDPGNIAPSLAGNLDWEPDVVLVDSVPIKVEADMSSEWSIIDRDVINRSAKQRLQKHGREEELEAARSAPSMSTETVEGTAGFQSSFVDVNSDTYRNLSAFSSFSAIKAPRQVLHPQANRGDNQSFPLNDIVTSSARGKSSRLVSSIPPAALPAQRTHDAGDKPLRCELCGKTFSKFQNLQLHERLCTRVRSRTSAPSAADASCSPTT